MGKRSDPVAASGVSPKEPKASSHVRADSVTQVEQKMIKSVVGANGGGGAGASVASDSPGHVPIDLGEVVAIPKKSKKAKHRKKAPKTPVEVESST